MPPKTGSKKSAKADDDHSKKKDSTKSGKKSANEPSASLLSSIDHGSATHETSAVSKGPANTLVREASQFGTLSEDNTHRELATSLSELGPHSDVQRESATNGEHPTTAGPLEADIKYEEPILPNLIVLSYEGGKEKGLYEGYGKATYIGGHSYSGDWSGGMMNGHGQYEWADDVVYTGTIVNNQIDGSGMYQWPDGSIYQGDVLRGRRHGTGSFRHGQKLVTYEGEWNMGNMHGKGTLQFDRDGQNYYTGDFICNVPFGRGRRQYASGNLYEGMWINGQRHGFGIFSWSNGNGEYTGQWEHGVQNGHGTHVWYIIRAEESQYALRNYYEGNFVDGLRHGQGTFFYSSGTKYTGEWKADQKHGKGKVIFRNGTMLEAEFAHDRITTPLTNEMTSMLQIELPEIRSKTPIPSASNALDPMNLTRSESRNTIGPSFKLQLDGMFNHLSSFKDDKKTITEQIFHVLLRHLPKLKQIYRQYARLGVDLQSNVDNTFLMARMQFWRFILDCQLHHYGVTPIEYDRWIAECLPTEHLHGPDESILVREFLNAIAIISFHLHRLKKIRSESSSEKQPLSLQMAASMATVIEKNILPHAGRVRGNLFVDPQKYLQASRYKDPCYKIYLMFCTKNKHPPHELTMEKRDFLLMLKRLQLVDRSHLSASRIISLLAEDDANIRVPGSSKPSEIRLDIEMCFLEFFEALVGCALAHAVSKVPSTGIKPFEMITSEASLGSQPSLGSPHVTEGHAESRASEFPTIVIREVSELTHETTDDLEKSRSLPSREYDTGTQTADTMDLPSYSTKLDEFFNGLLLPAVVKFEHIREKVRIDHEKTWQGSKWDPNEDTAQPTPYAMLVS